MIIKYYSPYKIHFIFDIGKTKDAMFIPGARRHDSPHLDLARNCLENPGFNGGIRIKCTDRVTYEWVYSQCGCANIMIA